MVRTIGTIETEKGLASIKHDDKSGDLTCSVHNGTPEVMDWAKSKSWRKARAYVAGSYSNGRAYCDCWVLCLRPVSALALCRSEESANLFAV